MDIRNTERNCSTCMFKHLSWRDEPCASCDRDCNHWTFGPIKSDFPMSSRTFTTLAEAEMKRIARIETPRIRPILPPIDKVIFNDPATIVLWGDGTKTVVKRQDFDAEYDPEKGLALCISKKVLGNTGSYYKVFESWLPEEEIMTPNDVREILNLEEENIARKKLVDNLQSENAVDECDIEKRCQYCKYYDAPTCCDPCESCIREYGVRQNWEPKDEVTE